MTSIKWLHLTDLHIGMREQDLLWPRMRDKFFDDLARLYEKCGSWDLVVFTGDLTNRGRREEFERVDRVLDELWQKFEEIGGFQPKFLAVPGNHDLVRPQSQDRDYKEAVEDLISHWEDRKDRFWEDATSRYRRVVTDAFDYYVNWWNNQPYRPTDINDGLLPGDFSWTFTKGDAKIGFLGLNSAFRQLNSSIAQGELSLGIQQFHGACDGDGSRWCRRHHTCFLLTHHPQQWLNQESRMALRGEIIPNYFSLHLCGHLHESDYQEDAEAGNDYERSWLGRSLFGIEYYGQQGTNEEYQRSHGYTAGRIDLICQTNKGRLFFWPREARQQGGWGRRNIVPDYSINLEDAQNTRPEEINLINKYEGTTPPDLPANMQLDRNECRDLLMSLRTKDEEIDGWKHLHEVLQQGCHTLAINRLTLNNKNKQSSHQLELMINFLISMCTTIQADLSFDNIDNDSVRRKLEQFPHANTVYLSFDYVQTQRESWQEDTDKFKTHLENLDVDMSTILDFIDGELKVVLQERRQLINEFLPDGFYHS